MSFAEELIELFLNHLVDEHLVPLKNRIWELEERMTSAEDTLASFVSQFNDETNMLAQRLDDLMAQVANSPSGVSSDQLNAALQPLSDRLKGLGADGTATVPTDNPTTTTDPTNSPVATDPSVNPAPDAPTDAPTPDPTVNPVDVPPDSLPADDGTATTGASVNTDPPSSPDSTIPPTSNTDTSTTTSTGNTNDFREDL